MPTIIDLPSDTIIDSENVPGASLAPSNVVVLADPPVAIQPLVAKLEGNKRRRFDQVVRSYHLRDVYVIGEGLVFDKNLNLYRETITQNRPEVVEQEEGFLKQARETGSILRCSGTHLLCGKAGLSNYGHWMLEMLPVVYRLREQLLSEGWKVLVPKVYPAMTSVVPDSLSLLGVSSEGWIGGDGRPMWVENLIITTGLSQHGVYFLPQTAECMLEISHNIPAGPAEKLWISREGLRRSLINEAEISHMLREDGWRIIKPNEMSLANQIAAAKGANLMAGVNGAGLTNLGFMRSGHVVSFMPTTMPDNFFALLAANRNLDFTEVRCRVDPSPDWAFEWDGPVLIKTEDIFRQFPKKKTTTSIKRSKSMPLLRADVIQNILQLFASPAYLEIGVSQGLTFQAISAARKVAVDPVFGFSRSATMDNSVDFHEVTSDEYFARIISPTERFDVIFIDGLHTFDQSLRDLMNAVQFIKPNGIIILDDTIPNSYDASLADLEQVVQLRERAKLLGSGWQTDDSWMGDVFKNVFFIASFMQQWSYATVQENHGQTVLWRSRRPAGEMGKRSVRQVTDLDYRNTILDSDVFKILPFDEILKVIQQHI